MNVLSAGERKRHKTGATKSVRFALPLALGDERRVSNTLALCDERRVSNTNRARSRQGKPDPDSDGHPVNTRPPIIAPLTPLWDRFLENLQLETDTENGRDFVNFIQNHCFHGELLFKDSNGDFVDTEIPLAVKMESLFETAWHRRHLALERIRRDGWIVNDETHELDDDDMKTLLQLRSPERRILIVCAMGG